jgi:hypothetical protein
VAFVVCGLGENANFEAPTVGFSTDSVFSIQDLSECEQKENVISIYLFLLYFLLWCFVSKMSKIIAFYLFFVYLRIQYQHIYVKPFEF